MWGEMNAQCGRITHRGKEEKRRSFILTCNREREDDGDSLWKNSPSRGRPWKNNPVRKMHRTVERKREVDRKDARRSVYTYIMSLTCLEQASTSTESTIIGVHCRISRIESIYEFAAQIRVQFDILVKIKKLVAPKIYYFLITFYNIN